MSLARIEGGPCETKKMSKELCQRSELADVAICKFYDLRKVYGAGRLVTAYLVQWPKVRA